MTEGTDLQRRPQSSPVGRRASLARRADSGGSWTEGASDLQGYWEILVRRSPVAVGIFLTVVLAVLAGTLLRPPVYRATALLEIRRPGSGIVDPESLFATEFVSKTGVRTQLELLTSASLARRVIRELELHRLDEFGARDGDTGSTSDTALQRAVAAFHERLVVHPRADTRLVDVSFDHGEPDLAARIVNATLSNYLEMRVDADRDAARWLAAQMDSVRVELRAGEEALRRYAEENDLPYVVEEDVAPEIRARVGRLEDELAEAEARRYEAESLFNLVVGEGAFMATGDRVVEDLTLRLGDLKREYARVSAIFTDDYPEARQLKRQIEVTQARLDEENRQLARRVEYEYRAAARRAEFLRDALEAERRAADALVQRSGTYHLLRGEVLANRELFQALQQKEKDARVSAALEATGVGVVDWAVPPDAPDRPVFLYSLALGLIAGLVLGVGGAFLREYLDDTLRPGEEVGAAMGLPVLAMIPAARSSTRGEHGRGVGRPGRSIHLPGNRRSNGGAGSRRWPRIDRTEGRGRGALADAFSGLRTSLLSSLDGPPPRSLLVSSCRPGEGKTTVSLNLALSLKRLDRRVLLVNADLRRPDLHRALDIVSRPGLADYLSGERDWRTLVHRNGAAGLHVLPSGGPVDNAGDLLSNGKIRRLLRQAEREYDLVLVDAPAIFVNAPDARLLAEISPGVLVVVRSGTTPRPLAARVVEAIPNVLGVIINDVDPDRLPGYYRDYFQSYADPIDGTGQAGVRISAPRRNPE